MTDCSASADEWSMVGVKNKVVKGNAVSIKKGNGKKGVALNGIMISRSKGGGGGAVNAKDNKKRTATSNTIASAAASRSTRKNPPSSRENGPRGGEGGFSVKGILQRNEKVVKKELWPSLSLSSQPQPPLNNNIGTTTSATAATHPWRTLTTSLAEAAASCHPPPNSILTQRPKKPLPQSASLSAPPKKIPQSKADGRSQLRTQKSKSVAPAAKTRITQPTSSNKHDNTAAENGTTSKKKKKNKKHKKASATVTLSDLLSQQLDCIPVQNNHANIPQPSSFMSEMQQEKKEEGTEPSNDFPPLTMDFPPLQTTTTTNVPKLQSQPPQSRNPPKIPSSFAPTAIQPIPPSTSKAPKPTIKAKEKSTKNAHNEAKPPQSPPQNDLRSKLLAPRTPLPPPPILSSSDKENNMLVPPNHLLPNVVQKGRQRVKPRKKKLTTLKKRVLMERLAHWESTNKNQDADTAASGITNDEPTTSSSSFTTTEKTELKKIPKSICLFNFIRSAEELKEEEEYDEIVSDLNQMSSSIGSVRSIYIPILPEEDENYYPAFVQFQDESSVDKALSVWNDMILGGYPLKVATLTLPPSSVMDDKIEWKELIMQSFRYYLSSIQNQKELPKNKDERNINNESTIITTVKLENILTKDDIEDEECLQESISDIQTLAMQFGRVQKVQYTLNNEEDNYGTVYIDYTLGATEAQKSLHGMMIGGIPIVASFVTINLHPDSSNDKEGTKEKNTIALQNIFSEDDYEDEECLQESTSDVELLVQEYGCIENMNVTLEGDEKGTVYVTYKEYKNAKTAVQKLNGMVLGGQTITAQFCSDDASNAVFHQTETDEKRKIKYHTVVLDNVLTEDDYDDEDCLQESLQDVQDLAEKYGSIFKLDTALQNNDENKSGMKEGEKGKVYITYDYKNSDNKNTAYNAAAQLDGSVLGGQTISAYVVLVRMKQDGTVVVARDCIEETEGVFEMNGQNTEIDQKMATVSNDQGEDDIIENGESKEGGKEEEETSPPLMYSGDKIIPEKYAACKRAPKIPNKGQPRSYATQINNENAKPLLTEMLGELMRLQLRNKDDKNARARRRLVMGLREVARGIRAHKVKMIIMANNLDEYGAIDSKLQEILDLAKEEELPVLFELNKRKLGKALGKSIKVAVVGIQNADGAHEQFKKLKKLVNK